MPTVKLDAKKGVVQESGENRIQINDMAIKYSSGLHGTVVPAFTSVTALAGATTLEVNTYYRVTATATRVYAMPAVANCTAGDVILVEYDADMANSTTHDYGTAGEFFSATSVARAPIASAHHRHAIDRADGTADDFLKLTGATNGGCGKQELLSRLTERSGEQTLWQHQDLQEQLEGRQQSHLQQLQVNTCAYIICTLLIKPRFLSGFYNFTIR